MHRWAWMGSILNYSIKFMIQMMSIQKNWCKTEFQRDLLCIFISKWNDWLFRGNNQWTETFSFKIGFTTFAEYNYSRKNLISQIPKFGANQLQNLSNSCAQTIIFIIRLYRYFAKNMNLIPMRTYIKRYFRIAIVVLSEQSIKLRLSTWSFSGFYQF